MCQAKFLEGNKKQIFIKNRYKFNNSKILKKSYIKFEILKVLKMFYVLKI